MSKIKKVIIASLVLIGSIVVTTVPVQAANTVLQEEISKTVNTALEEYLQNTNNLEDILNNIINETLESSIDSITEKQRTEFESQIKAAATNALSVYLQDVTGVPDVEDTKGLQNTMEEDIIAKTYEYTNNDLKQHLIEYVKDNVKRKISVYNVKVRERYGHWEENIESGTRKWVDDYTWDGDNMVYTYSLHVVLDRELNTILTKIEQKLNNVLTFKDDISKNVLKQTDNSVEAEALQFNQMAIKYIEDHVAEYTDTNNLLGSIRSDVKNVLENDTELRKNLIEGIRTYITQDSGQTVYNNIKRAVQDYCIKYADNNNIAEKFADESFREKMSSYISEQIGDIVKESIKTSLTPYIKEIAGEKLENATENITKSYINGGVWNLILQAVEYNMSDHNYEQDGFYGMFQLMENEEAHETGAKLGGDQLRDNIVSLVNAYIVKANLVQFLNETLPNDPIASYFQDYYNVDETGHVISINNKYVNPETNLPYETIGEMIVYETRMEAKKYIQDTIFPKIVDSAKTTVRNYMNGKGGEQIRLKLESNVRLAFKNSVNEYIIANISDRIAVWIYEGIGSKINTEVLETVSRCLKEATTLEEFYKMTGINLNFKVIKSVEYNVGSYNNRKISLEDVIRSKTIFGAERGRVIVPEENDQDPLNDATVELGTIFDSNIYRLEAFDSGFEFVVDPLWSAYTFDKRFTTNPYGAQFGTTLFGINGFGLAGLSRTIARYDTVGIKNLNAAEAYVLAHEKHTEFYPDSRQLAYYEVLKQTRGIESYDDRGPGTNWYRNMARVFSFASIVTNTDWNTVWGNIRNSNSLSELIKNISRPEILGLVFTTFDISIKDIFPFMDNDILRYASMAGFSLGTMSDWLGGGLSHVVSWFETGGETLKEDINGLWNGVGNIGKSIKNYAQSLVSSVTSLPSSVASLFGGGNMLNEANTLKNDVAVLTAKRDSLQAQYDALGKNNDSEAIGLRYSILTELNTTIQNLDAKKTELDGLKSRFVGGLAGLRTDDLTKTLQNLINRQNATRLFDMLEIGVPMNNEIYDEERTEDVEMAYELAKEAMELYNALEQYDKFAEEHGGNNLVDITDYNEVKVSYSKAEDYIYVGPFAIDYVRTFYKTDGDYESEILKDIRTMENDDTIDLISFTGIKGAKLYADDDKTVEVKDWEFVYPGKTDEWNQFEPGFRDKIPEDDWGYAYPYPKEKFYVKFPSGGIKPNENYSINTLSKMTFTMEKMNADGQTYELRGDFDQQLWTTAGYAVPCMQPHLRCIHGYFDHVYPVPAGWGISYVPCQTLYGFYCSVHGVDMVSPWTLTMADATAAQVALVKIADLANKGAFGLGLAHETEAAKVLEMISLYTSKIAVDGLAAAQDLANAGGLGMGAAVGPVVPIGTPAVPGAHNQGWIYFCTAWPVHSGYHAQNLEEVIWSKIYTEYEDIDIEFGNAYKQVPVLLDFNNQKVNTTEKLQTPVRRGDIFVDAGEKVPQLPFLKNYATYPAWENYPAYDGNPNYPTNPYYINNEAYSDYPSVPYYTSMSKAFRNAKYDEAKYIDYDIYKFDPVIALTFNIEGTVWLDNPSGQEKDADGLYNAEKERGIPNVEVILHRRDEVDASKYVAKTLTDENGKYIFEFVRVGFDYYVEFVYDGMTYKSTQYMSSELPEDNELTSEYGSTEDIESKILDIVNEYVYATDEYITEWEEELTEVSTSILDYYYINVANGVSDYKSEEFMKQWEEDIEESFEVAMADLETEYGEIYDNATDNDIYRIDVTYGKKIIKLAKEYLCNRIEFETYIEKYINLVKNQMWEYKTAEKQMAENGAKDVTLLYSHAMEVATERETFNNKFNAISQNNAASEENKNITMNYKTWNSQQGAVSTVITTDERGITLDEYKMSARTEIDTLYSQWDYLEDDLTSEWERDYDREEDYDLYFPLDDQHIVNNKDLYLYKNYEERDNEDRDNFFVHTYYGLNNINLGLVQREQGDMAVSTELYKVITTLQDEQHEEKFDYFYEKFLNGENENGIYDILHKNFQYYTDVDYDTEIDPADYNFRVDSEEVYGGSAYDVQLYQDAAKELNVYLEYKILVRNNSTIQKGAVIQLDNSFKEYELEYAPQYESFKHNISWIEPIDAEEADGTKERKNTEILWHYYKAAENGQNAVENGYNTIYTNDLSDIVLAPGETVEVHLILRVKKATIDGVERCVVIDGEKSVITEINTYSFNQGVLAKSANPGSATLGVSKTYSNAADPAPFIDIHLIPEAKYGTGREISGYVWEDLAETLNKSYNNQIIGNGKLDKNGIFGMVSEPLINNVKVELIEVKNVGEDGKEFQELRNVRKENGVLYTYCYTGQDYTNLNGDKIKVNAGQYRFTNLPSGTYKIKFTYGDYEQLIDNIKYNAQDYKSLSLDIMKQQYDKPKLDVALLIDTAPGMEIVEDKNSSNVASIADKMHASAKTMVERLLIDNVQRAKVAVIPFSEHMQTETTVPTWSQLEKRPAIDRIKSNIDKCTKNTGPILANAIEDALDKFNADGAQSKVIVILTDGHTFSDETRRLDKEALQKAKNEGVKVITIAATTDEWSIEPYGIHESPTAGKLYNIEENNIVKYVQEVALEEILLEFENVLYNLTDAKDVEDLYDMPLNSKVGDIYSRQRNIDYSYDMVFANANVLNTKSILSLNNAEHRAEYEARVRELANNTKVTAITPNRVLALENDAKIENANLGLVERPQVDIRMDEKVSRIVVTLSTGEIIIDTAMDLKPNVQIIPKKGNALGKYSIYMDDEIMQGAKIDITYKITITNNSQVDTLGNYYDYNMFEQKEVEVATRAVPVVIGTLNNYSANLTFVAEDNTNQPIERNAVLTNYDNLISAGKTTTPSFEKPETEIDKTNGRPILLNQTVMWEDKHSVVLSNEANSRINNAGIKVVETTSLKQIGLYPNMSVEVMRDKDVPNEKDNGVQRAESSINVFVTYSKNLSANDAEDTMMYRNSTEIVERINAVGRRDYDVDPGNYEPNTASAMDGNKYKDEWDAAMAEDVVITPPYGRSNRVDYYVPLAFTSVAILGVGILFIKKKVL